MSFSTPSQLGRWYDQYANRLALYARQWCDRSAAEDAVQEAFVALASQRHPPANPAAWLFTTVRNAAKSAHRTGRRRDRRESAVAQSDWFEPDPAAAIDASAAEQTLSSLPDDQREIIVLRIWGALGWEEAAEVTGEPTSTLFSRYKAGLAAIRKTMESSCRK